MLSSGSSSCRPRGKELDGSSFSGRSTQEGLTVSQWGREGSQYVLMMAALGDDGRCTSKVSHPSGGGVEALLPQLLFYFIYLFIYCCPSFCLSWLRASLETGVEGGVHTLGLLTFPAYGDSGCSEDMAGAVWDLSQVQTLEWNVLAI